MKATYDVHSFLGLRVPSSRSAADGRNFADRPSFFHSSTKPETKKVCDMRPTLATCATSGRLMFRNDGGSWYHIAFGFPEMISLTVSSASDWHLPSRTKSGLKLRATESARRCVRPAPNNCLLRLSSNRRVVCPARLSARSVLRSMRHFLLLPMMRILNALPSFEIFPTVVRTSPSH